MRGSSRRRNEADGGAPHHVRDEATAGDRANRGVPGLTGQGEIERIHEAHRAGALRRLVDKSRLDGLDAEHRIARWERQSEIIGTDRTSNTFWDRALLWIAGQRAAGRRPG
jgi:hypothetical protein